MTDTLTTDLQNAELWPIKAKGAVTRLNPLSDPAIEHFYHKSMEQGRFLECSIADANFWLQEKKQDLIEKISMYTNMNSLAVDGQLKHRPRAFKYIADSIRILQAVSSFQQEITGLISAVTHNIGVLSSIEQNMLGMVQQNLNAIANLLNQVCNWGLPDLPAIPNFFSDTIWNWNGFNFFPLSAFQPHVGFDFNFAFNQCIVHVPNINIFRNYPSTVNTYSGLTYGTPFFVPPLGGVLPNTGQNLSNTSVPVYGPAFNPNSSMLGSLPDPSTIISNYQLPAQTYQDNILTLIPATRNLVIEPTDPDYNNPDLVTRQANERKALIHFITLKQVVASNYDPYVTSAWLFYLNLNRTGAGRTGNWLPNFQQIYTDAIQPSINSLTLTAVPYNNYSGTVVDTPTDIPFVDLAKNLPAALLENLLWKLSYVEASLLGYTRTQDWDNGADPLYLSSFTGSDLDYSVTLISVTLASVTLGAGTAQYPVPCSYPTSIATIMNEVITLATENIANTPGYQSPHPQYRFVYDQFAQAQLVDRYSQFWREFNNNLIVLLAQDPYIVQRAVSYAETLNSAINPLADSTDYNQLLSDCQTRNRAWVAGTPLLNLPVAPIVTYSNNSVPDSNSNGWSGLDLDPVAFLSRPDIQGQPIPIQLAMLRTNLSYAGIQKFQQQALAEVQSQIQQAQALLQSLGEIGFHVTAVALTTSVPVGPAGIAVGFDSKTGINDFDFTNNVTNPTTFTLQAGGQYALAGQLNWDTGGIGVRVVTVIQNGTPIFSIETDAVTGPVIEQFATTGQFSQGDVIQVIASHNLSLAQNVLPGSFFSMIQTASTASPPPPVSGNSSNTKTFTADSDFPVFSAIKVESDGGVSPIDVVNVITDIGNGAVIAPYPDGISTSAGVTGSTVNVATTYGGEFQVVISPPLIVGGLLYVKPDGTLTQDFDGLVAGTYGTLAWIVCVGRASAVDTFIYEPHIPTRYISLF